MDEAERRPRRASDMGLPAFADIASVIEEPWLGGDRYRPPTPDFALVLAAYVVVDRDELIHTVSLPAPPLAGRIVLRNGTELAWTAFLGGVVAIDTPGRARVWLRQQPL